MDLKKIQELAHDDMSSVNDLIYSQLQSDVALINQLGIYIVNAGGKRMRPMLVYAAGEALERLSTDPLAASANLSVPFPHYSYQHNHNSNSNNPGTSTNLSSASPGSHSNVSGGNSNNNSINNKEIAST